MHFKEFYYLEQFLSQEFNDDILKESVATALSLMKSDPSNKKMIAKEIEDESYENLKTWLNRLNSKLKSGENPLLLNLLTMVKNEYNKRLSQQDYEKSQSRFIKQAQRHGKGLVKDPSLRVKSPQIPQKNVFGGVF